MKKIKKIKHRVAALFLTLIMTLGCIGPAFCIKANAEAIEVMNGSCTIADIIMSYCASGGVAIVNNTVIDDVYNVYGSTFGTISSFVRDGLLTYVDGTYVDTGLSTSIQNSLSSVTSLDIGSLFNQTAQQNPTGVALTGAASLGGIAGSVATIGVLPVAVGVAISGYCGFQIGTLIANFLGLYDDKMGLGVKIDVSQDIVNSIPKGSQVSYASYVYSGEFREIYLSGDGVAFSYDTDRYARFGISNINNYAIMLKQITLADSMVTANEDISLSARNNYVSAVSLNRSGQSTSANDFDNINDFNNAAQSWFNGGSYNKNNSPDVIGSNGNIESNYNNETQEYTFPSIIPKIDPENESVNPTGLTFDDYINYANDALNNTNNGDPESNKDIFDDIMDNIRIAEPTPVPNPSPDPDPDPDPDPLPDPETVPVPSINPYPDTYPVADPETVPDNKPQPEYTEKATENETDIIEGDPYTTPNLLNKFPFCIPRDILKVFKKLDSGARQAPHIQWQFNPNNMIDYTFDIDFSTWDSVAALLRLLELAAFIIALGIATRNLILS